METINEKFEGEQEKGGFVVEKLGDQIKMNLGKFFIEKKRSRRDFLKIIGTMAVGGALINLARPFLSSNKADCDDGKIEKTLKVLNEIVDFSDQVEILKNSNQYSVEKKEQLHNEFVTRFEERLIDCFDLLLASDNFFAQEDEDNDSKINFSEEMFDIYHYLKRFDGQGIYFAYLESKIDQFEQEGENESKKERKEDIARVIKQLRQNKRALILSFWSDYLKTKVKDYLPKPDEVITAELDGELLVLAMNNTKSEYVEKLTEERSSDAQRLLVNKFEKMLKEYLSDKRVREYLVQEKLDLGKITIDNDLALSDLYSILKLIFKIRGNVKLFPSNADFFCEIAETMLLDREEFKKRELLGGQTKKVIGFYNSEKFFDQDKVNVEKLIDLVGIDREKYISIRDKDESKLELRDEITNSPNETTIFLSTHGQKDEIVIGNEMYTYKELATDLIDGMIKAKSVDFLREKVIFLSACYSGSFVSILENELNYVYSQKVRDKGIEIEGIDESHKLKFPILIAGTSRDLFEFSSEENLFGSIVNVDAEIRAKGSLTGEELISALRGCKLNDPEVYFQSENSDYSMQIAQVEGENFDIV